jgi:hypothetical protein
MQMLMFVVVVIFVVVIWGEGGVFAGKGAAAYIFTVITDHYQHCTGYLKNHFVSPLTFNYCTEFKRNALPLLRHFALKIITISHLYIYVIFKMNRIHSIFSTVRFESGYIFYHWNHFTRYTSA